MVETVFDAQGLQCPLPVLKTNKILHTMKSGHCIRVLANDRTTIKEFQEFCRRTGHSLVAFSDHGQYLSFLIKHK
ncbi:Sulfur carrier protein TusA [Commensalibacter sp. Nvir]|uniref:sulfurtransferase TusA family protein n=1 Tax=Commensalibacter sp. Nvir TaxID=3069817 RepID=UPI002D541BDC|nr:Sulfur carrier protein TusA [Commensalibacter sp. Nvir]